MSNNTGQRNMETQRLIQLLMIMMIQTKKMVLLKKVSSTVVMRSSHMETKQFRNNIANI